MSLPAVAVGDELEGRPVTVTRADLVRYAGASGDLNPIHWNERTATAVGLPGVIAHGMLTMALAAQFVADWAGDPAAVRSFSTRFTRPVVVPDDDQGATVTLGATVKAVDDDGSVTLGVTALGPDGKAVLGKALAVVRAR
ncbi:MaoC/PaaZ C-terminal domain-containing protein [Actinomycetospora termitidis]|uniref:MaoC/PaaZ C-terminal domain-containing protein n=1 Tax=Actinomycetospora termitidis TaxID=3053470 RepID=A0ABT7M407_9PSEU|nr:MaoC/PaaZ C-terminal domain-containing protein [Actinomycetospora sp. Odt1-22]MDL5155407.1 MaoC/PaaZ C-terminal domain-containing protein [Actinomycetospora sp. Odt1-22]